ncbi:hypothetical protein IEQ34_022951 [Dendrobium chrysotoxum]|uniref:Uncharacterized protein n=1 Tax=Dendrobium chrysotoxum TaxID=161865 RepID=A0AAV7FZA5_DENCH|nr:hypothetical protein IEQ34_022951 [Dendrobium chrysotoxum]
MEEKQMKRFHKNSRRIENKVFIMYMPDYELVTASNLRKSPNFFKLSLFGMGNSPTLGTYYSPRWRRADIEVPNLPVDVNSWGRSACYLADIDQKGRV